jgi:murein DD-endopeptidase MepM/ murein hydrolase activator NlpD
LHKFINSQGALKFRKTLYTWLTTRYRLILRNEENFEETRNLPVTPSAIIFFIGTGLLVAMFSGLFLGKLLFDRHSGMGDKDGKHLEALQRMDNTIDSLLTEINRREVFLADLRKVIGGDVNYLRKEADELKPNKDTTNKAAAKRYDTINIDYLSSVDKKFRQEFEGRQVRSTVGGGASGMAVTFDERMFFSPVRGIVTEKYRSSDKHYGVDVVAKKDEPIKAIAGGTVILSSWTDDTGYVIAIQHQGDIISVYKHCSVLMKKVGNFVEPGEIIALIGNSGKYTTGPHLHFELWYKGNPLDPEKHVVF